MAVNSSIKAGMLRALEPFESKPKKKKFDDPPKNMVDVKPILSSPLPPTLPNKQPSFASISHPPRLKPTTLPPPSPIASDPEKKFSIMTYKAPEKARSVLALNHDVVKYLRELEKEVSAEQIKAALNIDVLGNEPLMEQLRQNPKISFEDGVFSYKSKYPVRSREEVLALVRKNPDGIEMRDLIDSYKGVDADVKALALDRQIYLIRNNDTKSEVLFPIDASYALEVSPEFKELWHKTLVPDEVSLPDALLALGAKPMTQATADVRFKVEEKEKKKKQRKMRNFQNQHLEEHLMKDATDA